MKSLFGSGSGGGDYDEEGEGGGCVFGLGWVLFGDYARIWWW